MSKLRNVPQARSGAELLFETFSQRHEWRSLTIGNYLEPILTGNALAISPFVMLFAFMIWDFLWGMPGAFIGLP